MRTQDYIEKKLRLLIIQVVCNALGSAALVTIAVFLWMLWAKGTL